MTIAATPAPTRPRRLSKSRGFRPDIEGLRAVAVLSVLVYHLRSEWLPGGFIGVDIFFVISGFLITSHLVREHEKTGRISLVRFYARRMVRLIPAATVVLLGTAVATILFVPRILWQQVGTDIIASATYVINWVLALRSVDYLAEDSIVSPVQHFWSLAVEEQFYLIWPLLILLAGALAVRFNFLKRRTMAVGGVGVVVISFGLALIAYAQNDVTAYFSTFTRLWELAAGGLAALAIERLRRTAPPALMRILFYVGTAAVIGSVVLLALPRLWPAPLTVVPVLGTVLILVAGGGVARTVPERLLGLRPMTWVGGISYSLYLWHWPIIVIAGYVFGEIGLILSVAIAVASIALAWLSAKLVENPIRFSGWATRRSRNGLLLGLGSGLLTVVVGLGVALSGPSNVLQAPAGAEPAGAATLSERIADSPVELLQAAPEWVLPSPLEATADVPVIYADGCQQNDSDGDVKVCEYGDVDSDRVIALVGDSKAAQWQPALAGIAERAGFKLVVMTKSACAFSAAPTVRNGERYTSCDEWNTQAVELLSELKPALVLTSQVQGFAWSESGEQGRTPENEQAMVDGVVARLSDVTALGSNVAMISDSPQTPGAVYECVAENTDDISVCSYDLAGGIEASALPTQRKVAEALSAPTVDASDFTELETAPPVSLLDLTGIVCPPQLAAACPAVIGNALIYRQGSHLTATYVETAEPRIEQIFVAAKLIPAD
jgi:peptidoglycan/LPS O-acetylase OafA/YrhL